MWRTPPPFGRASSQKPPGLGVSERFPASLENVCWGSHHVAGATRTAHTLAGRAATLRLSRTVNPPGWLSITSDRAAWATASQASVERTEKRTIALPFAGDRLLESVEHQRRAPEPL